jgi:hypothetical protein
MIRDIKRWYIVATTQFNSYFYYIYSITCQYLLHKSNYKVPKSRNKTTLARIINGILAPVSTGTASDHITPPYDKSGSFKFGCCNPLLNFQSKLPLSIMIPPIELPCPPINFVNEWITIDAPCLIGLHKIGLAVLSIIKGIPYFLPISATSCIGKTRKYGLGKVSP